MVSGLQATRRVDALFRALSTDFLLREQFVTDPAQILSEYVRGEGLPPEEAATVNHLLYAVLSNPGLLNWLRQYAVALHGEPPSDKALAAEFGQAVSKFGDAQVTFALIRSAHQSSDIFTAEADLLRAFIGVLARTPGNVSAGTEMSPGGGTEMSPGGGTEMSPGARVSMAERLAAGTEMSPGGGTEMSPGGGTEMSPGRAIGLGAADVQVTLNALTGFANQLRARGDLNATGHE